MLHETNRRERGNDYAEKATRLFDVSDISITTVQACVLLGTLCFAESKTEGEALYYAVAVRVAQILDLPRKPAANELERQVNLRGV